jgi:penicillin-binding protein 1C
LRRTTRREAILLSIGGALGAAVCFAAAVAWSKAELVAPEPTRLVVDRHGRFLGELANPDAPMGYWPVNPMPPRVAAAMIAIEDKRFWSHPGVDLVAAVRAFVSNVRSGRHVSGASTIPMQVARMQDPGARTYPKKAIEALTAMMLVGRFGRDAVLEHYLRIAPYSNRVRGIDFAARRYFDKPATDLSFAEIAFLSAIPQSPSRMNPYDWRGRERAIARGHEILDGLAEAAVLSGADLSLAHEQIERIAIPARPVRPTSTLHALLRMRNAVPKTIVRTSLDLELQETLEQELSGAVLDLTERNVDNGALVVVDHTTMEVVAYVGSAGYFEEDAAGAIDFAATPRPPGSTLKPFVYGLALDRGVITPATIVDDLFRARGGVHNADHRFLGPLLPRVALANSRNVPAANLVDQLGLGTTYDLFATLDLHDHERSADHYGVGLALGLLPVSLFDVVSAYAALANDGRFTAAHFTPSRAPSRRVLSAASARRITAYLADPLARLPTFRRMGASEYAFPVALKTGTSQGYRDAWTIAYTPRYVVGVWLGRPDARPMRHVGGTTASYVVRRVVEHLHTDDLDGFADRAFPPPDGHTPAEVCAMSGQRATHHCEKAFVEHFAPGEAPSEPCSVHVRGHVDGRPRTFVKLPARYASWAATQSFETPPPAPSIDVHRRQRPKVLRPAPGTRVMRDPESPAHASTMALVAEADPRVQELVWYVDGVPFKTVSRPFTARWPLAPGDHIFEARAEGLASSPVRVLVDAL